MKIKIQISSPDDSLDSYETSFLFRSNSPPRKRRNYGQMNQFGEIVLRCSPRMTDAKSIDPVIHSLQGIIESQLLIKRRGRDYYHPNYRYDQLDNPPKPKNIISVFTWKFKDGNFTIV